MNHSEKRFLARNAKDAQMNTSSDPLSPRERARLRARLTPHASLLTLSLLAATSLPQVALAQTINQGCTPTGNPSDNGAAADSYACAGAHPLGIAYTADGDLSVSNAASLNAGSAGVDLLATGTDSLTFNSAGISGSGGVDLSTELGALSATYRSVGGGVRATTAGGDLTLDAFLSTNNVLEATITGGAGNLLVNLDVESQGVLNVDTSASTGTTTVNHPVDIFADMRGFDISAGSGLTTLNLGNVLPGFNATRSAVVVDAQGDVVLEGRGLIGLDNTSATNADALRVRADNLTLRFEGDPGAPASIEGFTAGIGRPSLGGSVDPGSSRVDLSGVSTSAVLDFVSQSRWALSERPSVLSPGTNTVSIDATSVMYTRGTQGGTEVNVTTLDFNGGGTLNNAGRILLRPIAASGAGGAPEQGTRYANFPSELVIENLDTFNNSGSIHLGAGMLFRQQAPRELQNTDFWNDDVLTLQGVQFHGEAGSRIYLDADLSSTLSQQACDGSLRRADGRMPAADCVDLRGGGASGRTEVAVTDMFPGGRGAFLTDGVTLIDLAGSDPAEIDPEAFVLSPETSDYSPLLGGSIDKGMFLVPLLYDAEAQQFKLLTLPSAIALEQPMMASAAQELWRASTGSWLERQTEMRDTRRNLGQGGGVWTRVSNDSAERSITSITSGGGNDYTLETAHDVSTWSLTVGHDVVNETAGGDHWVFGGMVGYSTGALDFDAQSGRFRLDGMNIGVYAGYVGEHLYADLLYNGQWYKLKQDHPTLQLENDALLNNKGDSQGLQGELGWRWQAAMITLEPMLFFSLAQTTLDDVRVPGGDTLSDETLGGLNVTWDTARSRRAGIGLRGLHRMDLGTLNLQLNLTGRLVNEMEGKNAAAIQSPSGIDAVVVDDFSGQFIDLLGGATLGNPDGTVAGYLNLNLQSGDDYSRTGVSVGFRYQW